MLCLQATIKQKSNGRLGNPGPVKVRVVTRPPKERQALASSSTAIEQGNDLVKN